MNLLTTYNPLFALIVSIIALLVSILHFIYDKKFRSIVRKQSQLSEYYSYAYCYIMLQKDLTYLDYTTKKYYNAPNSGFFQSINQFTSDSFITLTINKFSYLTPDLQKRFTEYLKFLYVIPIQQQKNVVDPSNSELIKSRQEITNQIISDFNSLSKDVL